MKLIITSLIDTLPSVVEVSAVIAGFHVIFAIIGMMLFSGQFGSCTDSSLTTRAECVEPLPRQLADGLRSPSERLRRIDDVLLPPKSRHLFLPDVTVTTSNEWRGMMSPPSPPVAVSSSPPPLQGELTLASNDHAAEKRLKRARGRALNSKRKQMSKAAYRNKVRRRLGRELKGGGGGDDDDGDTDGSVEWLNPAFGSFDNFGSSLLILYVASTRDGWEEFMWAGMDVRGVDVAPERNDHSLNSAFFIAWMIMGCFVALNLFVGAIVDNFTRIKQESEGSATMTPEQQRT
jgi:hypothetical protein